MQKSRITKELLKLQQNPPAGVICFLTDESNLTNLTSFISISNSDSPYKNGTFKLQITLTARYPIDPPLVSFITKIHHPNIDSAGRICLDLLKQKPNGTWTPCSSLSVLLMAIQQLLIEPNPNDPLIVEIANEFTGDYKSFYKKAKNYTDLYATGKDQDEEELSQVCDDPIPESPNLVDDCQLQMSPFKRVADQDMESKKIKLDVEGIQEESEKILQEKIQEKPIDENVEVEKPKARKAFTLNIKKKSITKL